ncbi:MAG: PEGA domain-containing protein [Candidatus Latescibacterota bacterium]|nr:MAG: PEGA domain-containing protein [Candidatus Latescibacterota bacterium]
MSHMQRFVGPGLASLLVGLFTGCAFYSSSHQSDAHEIEPLADPGSSMGVLVAEVEGYPREIEYFINGIHIETQTEIEWWKDARIEVELRPGAYDVSATYLVRAFAGEQVEYHIETSEPVLILPGRETHIRAIIRKDWRGVPDQETTHFRSVDPGAAAGPRQSRAQPEATPAAPEAAPAATSPSDSDDSASSFVIHGIHGGNDPASGDGVIRISGSETEAGSATDPGTFVIRGSDVASTGAAAPITPTIQLGRETPPQEELSPVRSDADAIGLPPDDVPAHEELAPAGAAVAPGEAAPVLVGRDVDAQDADDAGRAWITVLLQSEPNGASVSVDDREVGQTPLRVRLDPTHDHVVRFESDGCGDHVRLLSAAGWERGHSSTVTVQLHCP